MTSTATPGLVLRGITWSPKIITVTCKINHLNPISCRAASESWFPNLLKKEIGILFGESLSEQNDIILNGWYGCWCPLCNPLLLLSSRSDLQETCVLCRKLPGLAQLFRELLRFNRSPSLPRGKSNWLWLDELRSFVLIQDLLQGPKLRGRWKLGYL